MLNAKWVSLFITKKLKKLNKPIPFHDYNAYFMIIIMNKNQQKHTHRIEVESHISRNCEHKLI